MKRVLCLILSLLICTGYLSLTVSALTDDTDCKSVDVFADELAELINCVDSEKISDDIISEASIDDNCSNRLIVKSEELLDSLDAVGYISGYNDLHILQFDNSESYDTAYKYYNSLKCVEYVEEDVTLSEAVINDGLIVECSADFPTEIPSNMFGYTTAKNESAGGYNVTIAVVDSGVQNDHEFLQGRVEATGFNSVTSGGTCYDDRGHGTQVAGIIVSNTLDNVKIKPYKVLDSNGEGAVSQVVLGIDAAIEDNVDIINLSMSMSGVSNSLESACNRAYDAGIAVVVAAGNKGYNMDNSSVSPGNFENVISVMSCSNTRYVSDFSNYGGNADCSAPGENIISSSLNNTYKISSGTSMAAPFICAALSYLLSKDATLTPDELQTGVLEGYQWCWGDKKAKCVYPSTVVTTINSTSVPEFKYPNCTFTGSITVEFTEVANTQIYYTFDGTNYYFYDGPFELNETSTVTAFAIESGKHQSSTCESTYIKLDIDSTDFTVDNEGNLTEYNGTETSITVPGFVDCNPVINVKEGAFSSVDNIVQSITFASTLKTIEANAFKDYASLKTIVAPSLEGVGDYAFSGCGMLSSFFAAKLTNVGEGAFEGTSSLSTFTTGSFTEIKPKTFKNSGISSVSLTDAIAIGDEAFCNCDNLTAIYSVNAQSIGVSAFEDCSELTTVTLQSASEIGDKCFYNCSNLINITTDGIKEIGNSCFENCSSMTSLYMPDLEIVGDRALYGCSNVTNITAPLLSTIGDYAFYKLPITSINFSNLSSVGEYAFAKCTKLKTVSTNSFVPFTTNAFNGVTTITTVNLNNSTQLELDVPVCDVFPNLKTFNAPNLTSLPDYAFSGCSYITTVSIPCVKSVGNYVFEGTQITSFNSSSIETISPYSFANMSKVTTIELSALKKLYSTAFMGCDSLITLKTDAVTELVGFDDSDFSFADKFTKLSTFSAKSLETIPEGMFAGSIELSTVYLSGATNVDDNAFASSYIKFLDLSSLVDYNNGMWGTTNSYVTTLIIPSVKSLQPNAFKYVPRLTQLDISGVNTLPFGLFSGCTLLSRVDASSVTTMEEGVFSECVKLSEIDLSSLNEIAGDAAFKNCTSLNNFIAINITEIPTSTFEGCSKLTTITAPNVTKVGDSAFKNTSIQEINFDKLTYIGEYAYANSPIQKVNESSVTYLGTGAFSGCEKLTSVTLSKINSIPDYAFSDTESLSSAYFGSVSVVGNSAFANSKIYSFGYTGNGLLELGEKAFYNCTSLNLSPDKIKRLGTQSVYNTKIFDSYESLPNLEYIDIDGFSGVSITNGIALENVIDVYDLPDNNSYALIGSDCQNFEIENEGIVYAPEKSTAYNWCLNNDYSNFIVYNADNILMNQITGTIKTSSDHINMSVRGFNTTYKLYGVNKDELNSPNHTLIETNTNNSSFSPIGFYDATFIEDMYDYYYIVAEDVENGNITTVKGDMCENTFTYIKPKNDSTNIEFDFYENTDHMIWSTADSYEEVLSSLYIDSDHVTITPTYEANGLSVYGTGAKYNVTYDGELLRELRLSIVGDLNGDGVVDALDCSELHKYSVGFTDAYDTDLYLYYAIDSNLDGNVDVNDYQTIVNKAVS